MLEKLLGSKTRAGLLRALFANDHRKMHLRELSRITGAAAPNLLREARSLVLQGVLNEEKDGNRVFYSANARSPVYAALLELVEKTASGEALIREAFSKSAAEVVFIYGSRANGTARTDSDYDVFVVSDEGLRKVVSQIADLHDRIGVEVNPYVVTPAEFARRMRERDHFLTEVMAGKRIFLKGSENELEAMAR